MDALKQQIRQRLIANMLIETCAQSGHLIFRDAWCSQDRVIRFTTPFFRRLFYAAGSEKGRWKTGDFAMYEARISGLAIAAECVLDAASLPYDALPKKDSLLKAAGVTRAPSSPYVVLMRWDLCEGDENRLLEAFSGLIGARIPAFEKVLLDRMGEHGAPEPLVLREGDAGSVTLNRYERNPKARAACIAAHGCICSVCGLDFGKVYGPEFAGKIEVHHIVPLSEIGESYVVDPVRDLVPVCPNCHAALHSKKGGVYTVEELKAMRARR